MMKAEVMDPAQVFMAEVMSRNKEMNMVTERGDSAVQMFYSGAAVFITGGSGFLGKQLIEKLFRATKISKVFVLLRPKKGKDIQQRLNEILQDPVYVMVREQQPDFTDKIIPIEGDVSELRLGISDKDWNALVDQVQIIFHLAATTRFDEPLRVATMINVRGTREALTLGKACTKLNDDWKKQINHVKRVENEYRQREIFQDDDNFNFIINTGESSSDDDEFYDNDEYSDSDTEKNGIEVLDSD